MLKSALIMLQPVLICRNQGRVVPIVVTIYRPSFVTMKPGSICSERNEITKRGMVLVEFSLHSETGVRQKHNGTEPLAVASGFPVEIE